MENSTVYRVEGQLDTTLLSRPPVLGAFLGFSKKHPYILIVTHNLVEKFNCTNAHRTCYKVMRWNEKITCCDYNRDTTLGSCVVVGCIDSNIRVYGSENLRLLRTISNAEMRTSSQHDNSVAGTGIITNLLCPLNNTVVAAYSSGIIKAFYLETSEIAGTYNFPTELLSQILPPAVTCLSFYTPKNLVIAGYSELQAMNETFLYAPVVVYSLQKKRFTKYYQDAKDRILSAAILDQNFLVACTAKQALIWDSDTQLVFAYAFTNNLKELYSHTIAFSAMIIPSQKNLFVSFNSGVLACLELSFPSETKHSSNTNFKFCSDTPPEEAGAIRDVSCTLEKLLKLHPLDLNGVSFVDACPRKIWFEHSTETLVTGDSLARVKLLPNVFRCHLPKIV